MALLLAAETLWSGEWEIAPAKASALPETDSELVFTPLEESAYINTFLTGSSGWFWLKKELELKTENTGILLTPPKMHWQAWWNSRELGESGLKDSAGGPARQLPVFYEVPGNTGKGTLLLKVFSTQSEPEQPPRIRTGTREQLSRVYIQTLLEQTVLPLTAVLTGILLLIGGIIRFKDFSGSRRAANPALTGLLAVLAYMKVPLSFTGNMLLFQNWLIVIFISAGAMPLLLSLWRRMIVQPRGAAGDLFSVLDWLAALMTSLWLMISVSSYVMDPRLPALVRTVNPLPFYAVWTVLWAVLLSVLQRAGNNTSHRGNALLAAASLLPLIAAAVTGTDIQHLLTPLLVWGLPLFLIVLFILLISFRDQMYKRPLETETEAELEEAEAEPEPKPAPAAVYKSNHKETPKTVKEEIVTLKSIDDEKLSTLPVLEKSLHDTQQKDTGALRRSLRKSFSPDRIPWDNEWDVGSARLGMAATGFHDVYSNSEGKISGFAFMDCGSDSLESMIFTHLVQSTLLRNMKKEMDLPSLARSVHRKTAGAAQTAGRTMRGVIGCLKDKEVWFLPLSTLPLMLRKADGRVISLNPQSKTNGINAPLGSRHFGSSGLKIMKMKISRSDVLLAYTPKITEKWSTARLARALRDAGSREGNQIVSSIIEDFKDYTGKNVPGVPLQLLSVRRR